MATQPAYAATPRHGDAAFSTANTNKDGTGTIADLFVGGVNGSAVTSIKIKNAGTVTAGKVRIFIYNGSSWRFYDEVDIPANTPSATVSCLDIARYYPDLVLPANTWKVGVATNNAESFIAHANGGDF